MVKNKKKRMSLTDIENDKKLPSASSVSQSKMSLISGNKIKPKLKYENDPNKAVLELNRRAYDEPRVNSSENHQDSSKKESTYSLDKLGINSMYSKCHS